MVILVVGTMIASGQTLTFDVTSIKRNTGVDRRTGFRTERGSFQAINVPAILLIQFAYGIVNEAAGRIIGAPSWTSSDRFDIAAKFSSDDQNQVPQMTQALLADRFKLVAHHETRPMPVYHLVFAKRGVLGRGLALSPVDCSAERARCGTTMDNGFLSGRAAMMGQVSNSLSFIVGRTVIDRTDVDRRFDFTIRFSNTRQDSDNDSSPTIFTVLQEDLGLKLVPATEPLDLLVIERIDKPSED